MYNPIQPQSLNFGGQYANGSTNMQGFAPALNTSVYGVQSPQQTGLPPQLLNSAVELNSTNAGQQDLFNLQGVNQFDALGANNPSTNMFGDFTGTDALNFGVGAAQLGAGIYFQNKQLGQQQQALDLANTKYTDLRADRTAIEDANRERSATAAAQKQQLATA